MGRGNELVLSRKLDKAAALRLCVQMGWSSRGAEVELLHNGHQEEQELHPRQRLTHTRPLTWHTHTQNVWSMIHHT